MTLKRNGHEYTQYPLKFTGAGFATYIRAFSNKEELNWDRFFTDAGMSKLASVPLGYSPPYTNKMAIRSGGMACLSNRLAGSGVTNTPRIAAGRNMGSTHIAGVGGLATITLFNAIGHLATFINKLILTGLGEVTPSVTGGLPISSFEHPLILSGNGEITAGDLNAIAKYAAASILLEGLGEVISGNLAGGKPAEASLTGEGMAEADLQGLGKVMASVAGLGDVGAVIAGAIWAFAELLGEGEITDAAGIPVGQISAALAGEGEISTRLLSAVIGIFSTIMGQGGVYANSASGNYITADLIGGSACIPDMIAKAWVEATISLGGQGVEVLTSSSIASAVRGELLQELRQITQVKEFIANRLRINKVTGAWTVYAEDKVTPLYTGTLSDDGTFRDREPT